MQKTGQANLLPARNGVLKQYYKADCLVACNLKYRNPEKSLKLVFFKTIFAEEGRKLELKRVTDPQLAKNSLADLIS